MGVTYGYARVSTDDQDMRLQIAALNRYGIPDAMIFSEHASGKNMKRKHLKDLVERFLRPGDTLVVWKLDRLGRDLTGVLSMVSEMDARSIEFVSLTESFDTSTPMGKAFMQIAMVFAELERNMISERTRAGMAEAKKAGAKFGRAHTILDVPKRLEKLREMHQNNELLTSSGAYQMTARQLVEILNRADTKAPKINNPETVRRWKREGFPGLHE